MMTCIPFFKSDISWFEIIYSTIIPVILFFSGLWFSRLMENYKENSKQKRLMKYFFGLVDQLSKKINNQNELLKEAILRQDDINSKTIMTELATGESHLLLKDLDRSNLYEAFVLRKKKNIELKTILFDEIISDIDSIYKQFEFLEFNNKSLPSIVNKYIEPANDNIIKLNSLINDLKTAAIGQNKKDELLDAIVIIENKLSEIKKDKTYVDDLNVGYTILIEPLIELLKKNSQDSRASALIDLAQKVKFNYHMIKHEMKSNKEYFNLILSRFENLLRDMNEGKNKMKKYNVA